MLLFFPGAFTSVCTTELNTVGNDYARYTGPRRQVVGISTDSPFALAEFKKVNGFPFRLLSDHDGDVSAAYGAKYDRDFSPMKLDRIARRAAFVVAAGRNAGVHRGARERGRPARLRRHRRPRSTAQVRGA